MPSWQPNWEDVRFDYPGAEQAAADCDGCAQFLAGRHAALRPPIDAARAQWRGLNRERFDDEATAIDHHAEGLADELRMTAARIRAQADEARAEQHRRMLDREHWFAELAREEAAEMLRLAEETAATQPASCATT